MGFRLSTCPYCAYGCGLLLDEFEGRLVGSYPASAHPFSKSSLCIRGWNSTDSWTHPDRLVSPLLRDGKKLSPVSPEKAVGYISERLTAAGSSAGSVCLAVSPALCNEDILAVRRFAALVGASIVGVDLSGAPVAHRAVARTLGRRFSPACPDLLDSAELVWVLGADLFDCPQIASRVNEAEARGAAIVSFDVFEKSEKPGRAHVGVPAGDFLLLSLILEKVAFQKGRAASTLADSSGFGELYDRFKDTSWIPRRSGLDEERIGGLCQKLIATPNSAVIVGQRWLTTGPAFEQTVQLVQALALMGAADRLLFPVGESNSWGLCNILTDFEGPAVGAENFLSGNVSDLAVLFVSGDDLLRIAPRPDRLKRVLSSAGSVVVIDRFVSDCMAFADVVLPSCGFAETEGAITSAFGTLGRWRQAVSPPGHAASERVWLSRIARSMGMQPGPQDPLECWQPIPSFVSPHQLNELRNFYETDGSWLQWGEEDTEVRFAPPQGSLKAWPREWPTMLFFTRHPSNWRSGAVTGRDEILKRENLDRVVFLSPGDLKSRGMKPGAKAVIETPHGSDTFVTREEPRLPDGIAFVQDLTGAGRAAPGLSPVPSDDLSFQPAPCRIQKA